MRLLSLEASWIQREYTTPDILKSITSRQTMNLVFTSYKKLSYQQKCTYAKKVPTSEERKDQFDCMCHSVPYKRYTKLMTVSLIESVTYWLNHFPSKNGVSQSLSPANIVIRRPKPNFNHKKITFGSYAMVYTRTTSTMK